MTKYETFSKAMKVETAKLSRALSAASYAPEGKLRDRRSAAARKIQDRMDELVTALLLDREDEDEQ
jgi:hypothetical protein